MCLCQESNRRRGRGSDTGNSPDTSNNNNNKFYIHRSATTKMIYTV